MTQLPLRVPEELARPKNARDLVMLRKFYDQTVWRDERLAEEHEKWIVRLWDAFLNAENNWDVIANAQVKEMIVGMPESEERLDWRINRTLLGGAEERLDKEGWLAVAAKIKAAGFEIVDTEWHHSEFIPPKQAGEPARSVVSMVIHALHKGRDTRYVVRGDIKITWSKERTAGPRGNFTPDLIDTRGLSIYARQGTPAFREATSITFPHEPTGKGNDTSPHPIMVHDLNGDHLPEVVVGGHNKVYWNRGNFQFDEAPFCDFSSRYVNAGALADFTGDGVVDYLCLVKLGNPRLYVGLPGGKFLSQPREIPLAEKVVIPVSVTAGDIDHDGDLDVFFGQNKTGYQTGEIPSPYYDANDSFPSYLLRNDGKGNFTDVTAVSGLGKKRNRRNFGSSFVDLNGDGHLDLLLTNDFCGNDLFLGDGKGAFRDITDQLVPRSTSHGMSHTFGDFNMDGHLDFITIGMSSTTARRLDKLQLGRPDLPEHNEQRKHMGYGNRMYLWSPEGFRQAPFNADVARTGWSWGSTTLDFDRDGDQDIYVVNGQTSGKTTQDYCTQYWCHDLYIVQSKEMVPAMKDFFSKLAPLFSGHHMSWNGYEHNALLMNVGGSGFVNVGFLMNCGSVFDSRMAASADLDLDGRVDLIYEQLNLRDSKSVLHFLRNGWEDDHHWIGVHLDTPDPQASAMGAKVIVETADGKHVQHVATGHSVWAQHPNTLHFGLGKAANVKSLQVVWPDGKTTKRMKPQPDTYHVVRRGES